MHSCQSAWGAPSRNPPAFCILQHEVRIHVYPARESADIPCGTVNGRLPAGRTQGGLRCGGISDHAFGV